MSNTQIKLLIMFFILWFYLIGDIALVFYVDNPWIKLLGAMMAAICIVFIILICKIVVKLREQEIYDKKAELEKELEDVIV